MTFLPMKKENLHSMSSSFPEKSFPLKINAKALVLDEYNSLVLSLSSTSNKCVNLKSKKDEEIKVPTELRLHWLNDGILNNTTKKEWNDFISVIQDKFYSCDGEKSR